MSSKSQISVLVRPADHSQPTILTAQRGQNLRTLLLSSNLTPYQGNKKIFNCRGMGICGTCKVLVLENQDWWDRRSCQIQCFQNLEIQLK